MANTARKRPIEIPLFRVTNRRDSIGLDSTFSVAPPGYTSQKGQESPVQTLHSLEDDDSDTMMHSFAEADLSHMLPSPYSQEDFQAQEEHREDSDEYSSVPSSCTSRIVTPRRLNIGSQLSLLPIGGYSTPSPQIIPGVNPRSFPSFSTGDLLVPQIILEPPTNNPRATNYVSISRKNTLKKSSFFRQKTTPSSITGEFSIDPNLNIPSGLLNSSAEPEIKRKNLSLEVENGGIDVDVNLIPSGVSKPARYSVMTLGNDLGRASSTSSMPRTHYQSIPSRPLSRRSVRDATQPQSPQPASGPTLIDLRLKDNLSTSAKHFPLVARIHAPRPRPPFHLLASTIAFDKSPIRENDDVYFDKSGRSSSKSSPTANSSNVNPPDSEEKVPHLLLSKSNLSIHLPHTFHGPLAVHVAVGDIDEHVHLSEEVKESVVVLSESSVSRVYFIGSLRKDEGSEFIEVDEEDEENDVEEDRVPSRMSGVRGRCAPECAVSRQGSNKDATALAQQGVEGEEDTWNGDKVDVVVGRGHIYLQFLDEQEPFRKKKCFWRDLIPGSK